MSVTIPASGARREDLLHEQTEKLSDAARLTAAGACEDSDQLKELTLMLGLTTTGPDGSLVKANPWEAEFRTSAQPQPVS